MLKSALRAVRYFAVMGMVAAAPALAQAEGLTATQKEEIGGLVREYILKNPEIIMEAVQILEQRQQEAQNGMVRPLIAANGQELRFDPASHVAGNPDGDVTIVEFFDYRCGYCKGVYPRIVETMEKDKNVRILFKEFPILGPDSTFASRAAIASMKQGKYQPFHDAMMKLRGNLTSKRTLELAEEVGIDLDRLKEDMKDPEIDKTIERNMALAQKLNINGTPAFIIGDELVPGAITAKQIADLIEGARKSCQTC